ncbi:GGDEF domain-containing phosphodiesterase [Colwellia hornerae]|uniref:EAL domain-containing protein n=1 Tax=Colwellia hornerae TaxID=89402 RepID=A0A5C6QFZ9_9GAMM|nr:GGDEF domain-containing phosphodiesterase [Colwellia hornerae]TWX52271.1 EAL domain-containing protein [Colwellia hornerae]TWX57830.1 EAL domain-containing protein [Colwellia hornerae]TWX67532.1 EAL domain-containing protein [Colwellia hornerae]
MIKLPSSIYNSTKLVFIVMISLVLVFILNNVWQFISHIDELSFSKDSSLVTSDFSYTIDRDNSLDIKTLIKNKESKALFIPSLANDIPYELGHQSYWVKININNNTANIQSVVLHADNSRLAFFDVYKVNAILESTTQIAQQKPTPEQETLLDVFPHVAFDLLEKSTVQVIAHIKSNGPPNIPLILYSKENFDKRTDYVQMTFGIFIGIMLLMAAYNFVLFFATKDKVYLVYIGYLLSAFIVIAGVTGYGYLIFSKQIQYIIHEYSLFLDYFMIFFLLLFSLYFLRYDQIKGKFYRVGLTSCLLLILVAFYSLTLDQIAQTKLFFSIQPIFILYALFIIFRRLSKDFAWARFYFISWLPFLAGAAIQPLVLLNYVDSTFITRNAFLFAVMIEITFMAFALAERMRRNEQDRIHDISYHDFTKLPRKSMLENAMNEMKNSGENDFCVLIIKPEHIEQISLYIDDKANAALFKRLSRRLSSLFIHNDAIVELSSNHEKICFLENNCLAIIVNHEKNQQDLPILIKSIQQLISETFQIDDLKLPLSAVIGVANHPEHGSANYLLINHALLAVNDAQLVYGRWAYYQSEKSDHTSYLLKLATDLKAAIEHNTLAIYHQPQIDLKTLRVCSSECLIRWDHHREGFISPDIFIPLAEDLGLINQLTLWVIKRSLAQHQQILVNNNHMVSINISGKDIAHEHFFTNALSIIEESGIAAEKIILELTESASISHNQQSLELIQKLGDLGFTISIDDFGTGYSSMAQISHLPFQELKVDRQFVENVNDDHKRKTIAEATVKMAKGLGLEVVAEGINSQEDEDTLRSFGCDIGQGYYYAKPMPIDDYLDWLASQNNGRTQKRIDLDGEFIPADKI